jgi:hypothetical protein
MGDLDSAAAALAGVKGFVDADQHVNRSLVKKCDGAFHDLARDREYSTEETLGLRGRGVVLFTNFGLISRFVGL